MYWKPGGSSVGISRWEGHKTIKSAKKTLPVKPNEAAAIISGLDWHCPAARPDSERHAGSWLRGRDEHHDGKKKIKNPLSGFQSVEYSYSRNVGWSAWAEGENSPKGIQIIAALKCYSKIQEAILCPFLNPHHQVNELLFSHSGINECNKAGALLPGERASVILMELDRVTHNPPLLPQLWWKKKKKQRRSVPISDKRYYIDKSHVAKRLNGVGNG